MTDQDIRDFLERMAVEEQAPFLDAEPVTRRARILARSDMNRRRRLTSL